MNTAQIQPGAPGGWIPRAVEVGGRTRVVPPEPAEIMAAALRERGVPVAHVAFPGEGRGFGFTPAGDIEPVEVEGL